MFVQGIAPVESVRHIPIAETVGVAAAAPGVVAQPLHGVAMDGDRQVALVVFQGVVHGASSVVIGDKDSKQSRSGGQIVHFFRHAVFGDGLVKGREMAFHAGSVAVAEGLHDTLAVDAVVHAEGLAVLLQRTQ